jgi:DNA polymerase-1
VATARRTPNYNPGGGIPKPAPGTKPRLFILDAYAYLFRAYHALPPLATSKGVPTGATYGFLTAVLKVLREQKPGWVCVVWDAPGGSFRDGLYEEYKANRTVPPDDLVPQFKQVRQVASAMSIPHLEATGFEADDVIASLCRQAVEQGIDVAIVSGDKDLMCLVNEHVTVLDLVRYKTYDRAAVIEKFGVPPEQMTEYLALVGDTSDNVPGVRGVGPKTATQLLSKWGTVENILANLPSVEPERVRNMIETSRADLELSRKLVQLDPLAPVAFDKSTLELKAPDAEALRPLLMELEFHRLIPQFAAPSAEKKALSRAGYRTVLDEKGLLEAIEAIRKSPRFSLDLIVEGQDPFEARLVGISFATDHEKAWYVPLAHSYLGVPAQLPVAQVLAALKPLLEDPDRPKVMQGSKFDFLVLERLGVVVKGFVSDPMIAAYLVNPDRQALGLTELAKDLLEHNTIVMEEITGRGAKAALSHVPVDKAMEFAAEEAQVELLLSERLESHLKETASLDRLYRELETPLVRVLAEMEKAGITIDVPFLQGLSKEYEKVIQLAEKKVFEAAGVEFNIASPIQLRQVLFERLKLPIIKRTRTGPSTDVDVLEKLAERHPVPNLILEHRSKTKLKSTYIDALPKIVKADGRVHTTFNQTVAATGRLSSSDPNLQNIPIRTEEGRKIRRAFVAAPGTRLIAADYSQIELRIVAAVSGEPAMIDAFARGEDIHRATAKQVFGHDDDEHRSRAKAINFGIIYGLTKHGLALNIGISKDDAEKFIAAYFEKYPKIRAYLDDSLAHTLKFGYAETLFGRRRPFPDIHSRNPMLREGARRAAINHPIQGTAADLMKMAMLRAHARLAQENLRARMLLQIHDELVFEAPEAEVERVSTLARETMESVAELGVPLKVELGVGGNWDEV